MQTDNNFRPMRIPLDEIDSVEITAKVISEVTSQREGADRWAEIKILVTPNRMYIAQIKGCSNVPGEKTIISTAMVRSEKMLKTFLGDKSLAKKALGLINIK